MIELRADGSIPGAAKVGRVYKMAGSGKIWFAVWSGEFETDLPSYIETYAGFRGFYTNFLPVKEADNICKELNRQGVSLEEINSEQVAWLKESLMNAVLAAQNAAKTYLERCPEGNERSRANAILTNLLNVVI